MPALSWPASDSLRRLGPSDLVGPLGGPALRPLRACRAVASATRTGSRWRCRLASYPHRVQCHATIAPARVSPMMIGSLNSNLSYLLDRASHDLARSFHERLEAWEVSVPEWRVLSCLADYDGMSIGELARLLLLQQPSATKVLDQLEAKGLTTRRASPGNGRRTSALLTADGRLQADALIAEARAPQQEQLMTLTRAELRSVIDALRLLETLRQR